MEESSNTPKKPTLMSTKKELLEAYQSAVKQLDEKGKAELRPQAIDGASQSKSYVDLQRIFSDKTQKSGPDKEK